MGNLGRIFLGIATGGISEAVRAGAKAANGGKPAAPQKPEPLPAAPTAQSVAEDVQKKRRKVQASQSQTVYTSPLGVAGEANVIKQKLGA